MNASPFAFFVFFSISGIFVGFAVSVLGWFAAPERVLPFFTDTFGS
jgi:hypothetical protein